MKHDETNHVTNICCPNIGKRIIYNDIDEFIFGNNFKIFIYVKHCPYCGEKHKFIFDNYIR